jgi:4-aminobutyrate aminotransferase-like enzyme
MRQAVRCSPESQRLRRLIIRSLWEIDLKILRGQGCISLSIRGRNDLLPATDIRGPGAMVAFDIVKDRGRCEPDPVSTKRVVQRAYENGLILPSHGTNANTIRIPVPLTMDDASIDDGSQILEQALAA